MELSEDFWTDSPVHILKLSDQEFKNRKDHFVKLIEEQTFNHLVDLTEDWSQEMGDQFLNVLEKRCNFSLPLPEPIDVTTFDRKDLLAVFSKMHSRSFTRSMRLCKDVKNFLAKNMTKFSIRIRNGDLQMETVDGAENAILTFRRRQIQSHWIGIVDHSTVLPFTFNSTFYPYNGKYILYFMSHVFAQMKWPFLDLRIQLYKYMRLDRKPWMIGLEQLRFPRNFVDEEEWTYVEQADFKLVETLKPKVLDFPIDNVISIPELLAAAPTVHIRKLPKYYGVSKILKEWRCGEWKHNVLFFTGACDEPRSDFDQTVADCFAIEQGLSRMIFVPSPDNTFLVIKTVRFQALMLFKMFLNVRLVSDLLPYERHLLGRYYPIDYSAYCGDQDSVIDPRAFCNLFANARDGPPMFD